MPDEPSPTPDPAPVDESPTDRTVPSAAPLTEVMGMPLAAFVRGGTPTMGHERMMAERGADADRRRAEQDQERQLASVPIEEGGARLFSHHMTPGIASAQEKAYVLLTYCNGRGEPLSMPDGRPLQCCADIWVGVDPGHPEALTLGLVCIQCKKRERQDECQMRVHQWNRYFEMELPKSTEELFFIFDDGWGEQVYQSAGTIMESDPMVCPQCGWRVRIDRNKVVPV